MRYSVRLSFASAVGLLLGMISCSRNPDVAKKRYVESGEHYLQKAKYPEARIQFRNALNLDPRFVEAYYKLAQAELALHQWSGAFTALQRAVELDPGRLDARLSIGQLHISAKQYEKAEEVATAILERDPSNPGAYQLLGTAFLGRQQSEKAHAAFTKLTELMPKDPSGYVNLGLVEITLRRYSEAEQHLRRSIEVDPKALSGYSNLASLYRLQGQLDKAEQVVKQGMDQIPDAAPLYLLRADILYAQDKKYAARAVLERLWDPKHHSVEVAIALGDFYVQHQDAERTLAEYRRGLSVAPENSEVMNRMVEVYLETSRIQEAMALNEEILRVKPKDVLARVQHGRILLSGGKREGAISELRRLVAEARDSPQVHHFLGLAYWQSGEIAQPQSDRQEGLKTSPDAVPTLRSLAELHLAQGNLKVAKEYALRDLQLAPSDVAGHLLLGTVFLQSRELALARQQFSFAQQLAPDNPTPHLDLALGYASEGKLADAEKEFDSALGVNPRFTQALAQLANYLAHWNQRPKALARVQQYVATYPEDANGHLILGSLQVDGKLYPEAEAELERAIQLDPNLIEAYLQLGRIHQELGETDVAITRYEKALALGPNSVVLQTLVGNLYLNKGDLATARKYYERALAVNPNFAVASANLAWVLGKQGENLDIALGLAQKAKQLLPELEAITDVLGWIQYLRGSYASAIPTLRECVQKVPSYPAYRYHLGMALLASGDKEKAKAQLETALKLGLTGEDGRQASQALAQLR